MLHGITVLFLTRVIPVNEDKPLTSIFFISKTEFIPFQSHNSQVLQQWKNQTLLPTWSLLTSVNTVTKTTTKILYCSAYAQDSEQTAVNVQSNKNYMDKVTDKYLTLVSSIVLHFHRIYNNNTNIVTAYISTCVKISNHWINYVIMSLTALRSMYLSTRLPAIKHTATVNHLRWFSLIVVRHHNLLHHQLFICVIQNGPMYV